MVRGTDLSITDPAEPSLLGQPSVDAGLHPTARPSSIGRFGELGWAESASCGRATAHTNPDAHPSPSLKQCARTEGGRDDRRLQGTHYGHGS